MGARAGPGESRGRPGAPGCPRLGRQPGSERGRAALPPSRVGGEGRRARWFLFLFGGQAGRPPWAGPPAASGARPRGRCSPCLEVPRPPRAGQRRQEPRAAHAGWSRPHSDVLWPSAGAPPPPRVLAAAAGGALLLGSPRRCTSSCSCHAGAHPGDRPPGRRGPWPLLPHRAAPAPVSPRGGRQVEPGPGAWLNSRSPSSPDSRVCSAPGAAGEPATSGPARAGSALPRGRSLAASCARCGRFCGSVCRPRAEPGWGRRRSAGLTRAGSRVGCSHVPKRRGLRKGPKALPSPRSAVLSLLAAAARGTHSRGARNPLESGAAVCSPPGLPGAEC